MNIRVLSSAAWLCAAIALAQAPTLALAQAPTKKPAASAKNSAGNEAADAARRAQAIVSYDGGAITVGMVEDDAARQNAYLRSRYADKANLKDVVDRMLRLQLLSDEAQRRGYGANEVVQQAVKQNAVQLLMKTELDEKLSPAAISKSEIDAYYKEHIDEYVQPALVRASVIELATEAEAKALLPQTKSMDLRAFRSLATSKSTDEATKLNGGDLRYFDAAGKVRGDAQGNVAMPIVKAAFALKNVGDTVSAPVKAGNGYYLVKLTGQRPAISRKPSEVEEAIRGRLWRDRRQAASEALVKQLQAKYPVEQHPELLDAIKLDDAPQPAGAVAPSTASTPNAPAPAPKP